jgi:hypothetical protein
MKIATLVIVAEIFLLLTTILIGEEKTAVQPAGLRIVGPGYGLNGSELKPFNRRSGTTLALVINAPDNKKIVEIDDSKCSLTTFTDDSGADLLDDIDWGSFPEISKDGHLALIEVTSKNRPSQNAARLYAKGVVHMRIAAAESTGRIENLDLTVGTKIDFQQELIQVQKAQVENESLTLVLQISQIFKSKIKDIRFYTASNTLIKVWGTGSFSFGNASQMEYNLDINSTPKSLNVEIDLWQELETLTLPFEIESSIGF